MKKLFGKKKKDKSEAKTDNNGLNDIKSDEKTSESKDNNTKINKNIPYNVIVFDGNRGHDWTEFFQNKTLNNGRPIHVYQASWNKVELTVYAQDNETLVNMAPLHESTGKVDVKNNKTCTVKPHFVIIRNQPRGAIPETDRRKILYGLMMAGIPSMNSWQAIYMNLERPIMMGALKSIENKLSKDNKGKFPLIPATYYSSYKQMIISPTMPCVIKVSHAHAGMGKIKADNSTVFRDVSTILAVNDNYCTAEPFISPEYGIRVQKIGKTYRVMKKEFTGSGWKSQFGGAALFEIELTDEYKFWADECSTLFGGMDILAVDAIHGKNGKDYIIELNGTAIGIIPEKWKEDTQTIVNMCIDKMNTIYC